MLEMPDFELFRCACGAARVAQLAAPGSGPHESRVFRPCARGMHALSPRLHARRSEEMQLVQLIIPAEAAHDTVYQLGEVSAHAAAPRCTLRPTRSGAHCADRVRLRAPCSVQPRQLAPRCRQLRSRGCKVGAPQTGGQCWAHAFPR